MWNLERDEQGFWAVSGKTRVGPFTIPTIAREYMRNNEPPREPVKEQRRVEKTE